MVMDLWKNRRGMVPVKAQRDMEEFEQRVKDFFRGSWPMMSRPGEEREWTPTVDMYEKDGTVVLKAELPGIKQEDIDVSVEGDILKIKGERKSETETREEDYYQMERSYGSFFRSIQVPPNVDTAKIQAEYEDGVLQVTMPKVPGAAPQKVPVSGKKKEA